jgi:hypothetical protein
MLDSVAAILPFKPLQPAATYAFSVTNSGGNTPQIIPLPTGCRSLRLLNAGTSPVFVLVDSVGTDTVVAPTAAAPGSAVAANGMPVLNGVRETTITIPVTPSLNIPGFIGTPAVYLYAISAVVGPFVLYVTPGDGIT